MHIKPEREQEPYQTGVSVIVPVLNEAEHIEGCLRSVLAQSSEVEIVVVDGGSTDGTPEIAARYSRVLPSRRGRAVQMNFGARQATGGAFLFLHGDSVLPVVATSDPDAPSRDGGHLRAVHNLIDEWIIPAAEAGAQRT